MGELCEIGTDAVKAQFELEYGDEGVQIGISAPFAHTGYSAVYLHGSRKNRRDGAGDRHTHVIVAVDAEIERLKRLIDMGGFIPCPDHRIMPGSKFELVQYYAEEIKKIRI
jgi:hypothetical protein